MATGELAPIELLEHALGQAIGLLKNTCEFLPALCKRAWPEVPMHVLDEISRQTGRALNEIANTQIEFDHPAFTAPTKTPAETEETPAHE